MGNNNGPFHCGQLGEVQYLKKNLILTPDGIAIEPCKQYIPKLLELLHVENRRELYMEKNSNMTQNSMDRIENTAEKVGEALEEFSTTMGTFSNTLKDLSADQRSQNNKSDDVQKKMVYELSGIKDQVREFVDSDSVNIHCVWTNISATGDVYWLQTNILHHNKTGWYQIFCVV